MTRACCTALATLMRRGATGRSSFLTGEGGEAATPAGAPGAGIPAAEGGGNSSFRTAAIFFSGWLVWIGGVPGWEWGIKA